MTTLPPSKLNRLPEGLLSFFDIKSMGQYPQMLSDELKPTIDLFRFYADQAAEEGIFVIVPFAAANAGHGSVPITSAQWAAGGLTNFANAGGAATTVPDNEVWIVLEATIRWEFSATAGQEAQATLVAINPAAGPAIGQIICDVVQGFTTSAAAPQRAGQSVQSEPQFLLPGTSIRVWSYGSTVPAGQVDLRGYVRIRRLRR